jgi:hypothetical protein
MIGEKLSTQQRSAIISLTAEGNSITKTAKTVNCSRQSVQYFRKQPEVRDAIRAAAERLAKAGARLIVDTDLGVLEAAHRRMKRGGIRTMTTSDLLKLADKKGGRIGEAIGLFSSPSKTSTTIMQQLTVNSGSQPLHPAVASALKEAAGSLLGVSISTYVTPDITDELRSVNEDEMLPLPGAGGSGS